jgi:integrase
MKRRQSPFPPYTHSYRDCRGKLRCDFRRGKGKPIPLPYPLLGPDFLDAYRSLLADSIAGREPRRPSTIGAERTEPGTIAAGFVAYTGSASFRNGLSASTQRVHFNILSRWRDQWGEARLNHIQRRHVVEWLNERIDTPAAAQVFLKVVRRCFQYCISIDLIETDPTQGIKAPERKNESHHTWTDAEIEQYRRCHSLGSNARLALELLIGTGQRKSDVVTMGRQHIRSDMIFVRQQKTGWEGEVPITPELAVALAQVPAAQLTFLQTAWGRPLTDKGFGIRFRAWCNAAGLPHCSAHGLRYATARQLAEAGCTPHQIQAVTGHKSLALVQRYTNAVNQRELARAANKARTQVGEPRSRFAKNGD